MSEPAVPRSLTSSLLCSHSITIFTCESDNGSCDPRALVPLVLSQAFGHSNFQGIICKAEKHQPCLSCFSQVFLFPGDNSFISVREPYREISNSIALFFWPLIPDTYSCLITSCNNSQEKNEIAPGCRC